MRNIQELIQKINSKEKLKYSVYLNIGQNDEFVDVSNLVYDIKIDYTELKFDFTPSTATAKIKIYGHKNYSIINEIKTKISEKKLKIKIYIDLSENQKLKIFEGYIEYPTFKQIRSGFNEHNIEAEFFDYSYILKTKKIGRTKVIAGISQGGSYNTVILSNNASEINDFYNGLTIQIEKNGKIEEKVIVDYIGATKTAYLESNLSFEVTPGCMFAIKKRLTYLNCKKVDNNNKDKSLLHQIMYQAGFNDSYIQVGDILTEVQVVVFSEEISCFEAIKNLFQSELMIFDFSTGVLRAKSIDFSSISPVWTIDNTLQKPNNIYTITETIENNKLSYKSVRAEYNDIRYDNEKKYLYIFKDKDDNWKNSDIGITHNAYKYIPAGSYLPQEGYYSGELKYGDDCDVIYVTDIETEIKTYEGINGTPKIILSDFSIDLNKIDFRFYNNTAFGDILLEFKIKGRAYYIKSTDVIVEGNTLDGDIVEIKNNIFFADITQVRKIVNFYNHILVNVNKYTYTLKCNNLINLEIGDIVYCKLKCGDEFIGLITGVKQDINIFEPEITELTIIPVTEWTYNPINQTRNTTNNSLYTISSNYLIEYIQENNNLIENNVNETIEEAFTNLANGTLNEFGWTTTPEKINFVKATVDKWAITLYIQKQKNLSNFKQYELQVSEDGIFWYDFDFSQLDGITTINIETITFIGDVIRNGDEILGKGYYFRVRQRTTNNISSEWSDVLIATTIPFGQDERSALIYVDSNNFWDFITKKFRIGNNYRYLYCDGYNLYLSSIDLDLTSSELITYDNTRTRRVRYSDVGIYAETGENFEHIYGKIVFDNEPYIEIGKVNTKKININNIEFVNAINDKLAIYKDTYIHKYTTSVSRTQYTNLINNRIIDLYNFIFYPEYMYSGNDSVYISTNLNTVFRIGGLIYGGYYSIKIRALKLGNHSANEWANNNRDSYTLSCIHYSVYILELQTKVIFYISEIYRENINNIYVFKLRIFKITYQNGNFTQQILQDTDITDYTGYVYSVIFPSSELYNGNENGNLYVGLPKYQNQKYMLKIYNALNLDYICDAGEISEYMLNHNYNIKIGRSGRNPIIDIVIGTKDNNCYAFTTSNGNNYGGYIFVSGSTILYTNRNNILYNKVILNYGKNLICRNNNEKIHYFINGYNNIYFMLERYLLNKLHFWYYNNEQYASLVEYYLVFLETWQVSDLTVFDFDNGEFISGNYFIFQLNEYYYGYILNIKKIGNDIFVIENNSLKKNGQTIYIANNMVSVEETSNNNIIAVYTTNGILYITKDGLLMRQDSYLQHNTNYIMLQANGIVNGLTNYYNTHVVNLNLDLYELGGGVIEVGNNSNGTWIKFGDGTMICFGIVSGSTSGAVYVPYPTPFLYTTYYVYCQQFYQYTEYASINTTSGWSANGFSYRRTGYNGNYNGFAWYAIGRWK